MASEKSARGTSIHPKLFLEIWNEFFNKRRPPRTVVDRICEHMMSQRIVGVEKDIDHLRQTAVLHLLHSALYGVMDISGYMSTSVAMNYVCRWISGRGRSVVAYWQDNGRLHLDR